MKILMVTPDLPAPPVSGGRVRTFHLLRELGRRNVVDVVAPRLDEPEAVEASSSVSRRLLLYETTGENGASRFRRGMRALATARLHHPRPAVREMVRRTLEAESYDVVHFVTPYLFPSLPPLERRPPVLVDFFGTAIGIRRELHSRTGLLPRLETRIRYHLALKGEQRVLDRAEGALAISRIDREFFLNLRPRARVAVVPNGVDTGYFAPRTDPEDPHRVVFVGDMSFPPNVEAALYFAREVLPRLHAREPRVRLDLVGRAPAPEVVALGDHPAIRVVGSVPDVRPHVAGGALVVVPLIGGSGVRNKTLEAMAMGKAVVSTSMGVEGLDVAPDDEVSVANDPDDFAGAVLGLLASPERRSRMGERARACVLRQYRWETSAERAETFYAELASERSRETRGSP